MKIVKVEALDQSFGAFVTITYGGVNTNYVSLTIRELFEGSAIDFIVNIYAESSVPNDLIVGSLTENSVLLHT